MLTVGLAQLLQRKEAIVSQKEKLVAELNATIGAINLLNELIAEETAAHKAAAKSAEKKD